MKTNKLILLGLICLTVAMPTTAQNRNEKKERTERAVKEAIAAKQYKINVDRMQPMRGGRYLPVDSGISQPLPPTTHWKSETTPFSLTCLTLEWPTMLRMEEARA